MPSTYRIPRATLPGLYGRAVTLYARRTWGQLPDSMAVLGHNARVMRSVVGFEAKVQRWKALDPHLATYAVLASAARIGCSWCVDFGYFLAHQDGLDEAKVREVPRWRDSDVFAPLERGVIEYAEAMSETPPSVNDEMVAGLLERLGAEALVELTQLVALENMRSRFNAAAGLSSQGFSDVCELPMSAPPETRR